MKNRHEIVLAGSGGQGLIVCGMMLAEAAILEGKNVVQSQSYGIASRGGLSKAELIVDQEEIMFQQVQKPNIMLILTEEAMKAHAPNAADTDVLVFYDTTLLEAREGPNYIGFPFTLMGRELGHPGTANMVALGVMCQMTGVVTQESLEAVIRQRFHGPAAEMNLKALYHGVKLAQ
ncbi:MAG: 2-oxoacid:acceptor oxidoreductase family protein [Syntrophomonadaceae bacterium]|nr:2-oxoacid:acceptor oxidoreductase family protein [Syntrophomonadaceae bacterium]